MSGTVVGGATVEITADLEKFGAEARTGIESSMRGVEPVLDGQLAAAAESAAAPGREAGVAYTAGVRTAVEAGSATVAAAARTQAEAAGAEAGGTMHELGARAGEKFTEGTKEGLLSLHGAVLGGVGALGVGELIEKSTEAADQLEGSNIKIEHIFGESAASVQTWAKSLATSYGIATSDAEGLAGSFAQILQPLGIAPDEMAQMSEKLVDLSQDMARFNNADPATIQQALISGLRGRATALRQYGVDLSATAIQEEAYKLGLDKSVVSATAVANARLKLREATLAQQQVDASSKSTDLDKQKALDAVRTATDALAKARQGTLGPLTDQAKTEASYQLILKDTKQQEGAVADSSQTLAQRKAELEAQVKNLEAAFGNELFPMLSKVAGFLVTDFVPATEATGHWIQQNKEWLEPLAISLGVVLGVWKATTVAVGIYNSVASGVRAVQTLLAGLFGSTAEGMGAQAAASEGLAAATGEAAIGEGALAASATAADTALDANPIGLVVAALAALAIGLYEAYEHSETFREIVHEVGATLEPVWHNILEPVADFLEAHWKVAFQIALAVMLPFIAAPAEIIAHWQQIVSFFGNVESSVVHALSDAGHWLVNIGQKVISGLLTGLKDEYVVPAEWLAGLGEDVIHTVGSGASWLVKTGRNIINGLYAGILDDFHVVASFVMSFPQRILGWFSGAGEWLYDVGRQIISGLIGGMESMVSSAFHAVTGFLGGLVDKAKSTVGIHSPSTVFRDEVGVPIAQGIAAGITQGGSAAVTAIEDLAKKLTKTGQDVSTGAISSALSSVAGDSLSNTGIGKIRNQLGVLSTEVAQDLANGMKAADLKPLENRLGQVASKFGKELTDATSHASTLIGNVGQSRSGPQINVASTGISLIDKQLAAAGAALDKAIDDGLAPSKADKLRAQLDKLADEAQRQLSKLKVKIDGSDLTNIDKTLKSTDSTADDVHTAFAQLISDMKAAGDSSAQIKKITQAEKELSAAITERNTITQQLSTAQDTLNSATQQYDNDVSSVVSSLTQAANLSGLGSITDASGTSSFGGTDAIVSQLQDQATSDQQFLAEIQQLQSEQLDPNEIAQLISDGPAQAGQQVAALASASQDQIDSINELYEQIAQTGTQLGQISAGAVGDTAAVTTAQQNLDDIQTQLDTVDAKITAFTAQVSTDLAPAKSKGHKAGKDIADGIAAGIDDGADAVTKAAGLLGDQVIAELKRSLKIASPSRVAHDEIGMNVGLGVASGIAASVPHVQGALGDLVGSSIGASAGIAAGVGGVDPTVVALLAEISAKLDRLQHLDTYAAGTKAALDEVNGLTGVLGGI